MLTKKIKIKGQPYKIYYVNNLYGPYGLTDLKNKNIYIEQSDEKIELQKTIIHELTHAYLYECGLVQLAENETLVHWIENNFFNINNDLQSIFNFLVVNDDV